MTSFIGGSSAVNAENAVAENQAAGQENQESPSVAQESVQKPAESSENRGFLGNIFGGIMGGSAVNAP